MAQSCAARDANNKDNVCKPNIPAGIKCPPPSKTISPITWFGTISTRLAEGLEGSCRSSSQDPVRQCFFIDDGMSRAKTLRVPPRGEESPLGEELE